MMMMMMMTIVSGPHNLCHVEYTLEGPFMGHHHFEPWFGQYPNPCLSSSQHKKRHLVEELSQGMSSNYRVLQLHNPIAFQTITWPSWARLIQPMKTHQETFIITSNCPNSQALPLSFHFFAVGYSPLKSSKCPLQKEPFPKEVSFVRKYARIFRGKKSPFSFSHPPWPANIPRGSHH